MDAIKSAIAESACDGCQKPFPSFALLACEGKTLCAQCASGREIGDRVQRQRPRRPGEREYHRRYHRKRKYGLDHETYTAMLEAQEERCAICGKHERLHVDHDHATDKVRGLLCTRCNTGLGLFLDDPERLHAAAEYVARGGVDTSAIGT